MLYLKSSADIQALITGGTYASIDLATKNQIATHFEDMPASVLEAAYEVIVASLPTDEANFATALFSEAPPAGGSGSGSGGIGSGSGGATTSGDYVFRKDLSGVVGGAATDLDAVATAALPTGILYGLCLAAEHSIEAHYQLRQRLNTGSGSGSNGSNTFQFYPNGTTVIMPVDHDARTNDRVWYVPNE